MRLCRYSTGDDPAAHLGVVDGEEVVDVAVELPDLGGRALHELIDPAGDELVRIADMVAHASARIPLADVQLRAPVPRPGKLLAIGMNYREHVAEMGRSMPEFPVFFNKQTTCVVGPGDDVWIPPVSDAVDYEGELAVVVGRVAREVPVEEALSIVGGYTVLDDVSARDWQARAPTMTLGKSFDTHGPMGPWLVTPDEVGDPQDLRLRTWVNGELRQDASTADMVTTVAAQLSLLSTVCTLEPGDVVSTGTPPGVGHGFDPPRYLSPGDEVSIEIERVGTLTNRFVAQPAGTARW